ncbi:MAG TPA: ABC transporter substrate-binding protein [Streptosporangiaceae bacterium]|nr:ABC transporter substrate-binding protein [Streptosporangiaceae bacterium]
MRRASQRHGSAGRIRGSRPGAACGGILALVLVAAACSTAVTGSAASARTPVSGGIVTYALPANTTPNYIFPFTSGAYFSQVNENQLQFLLYRPLYWYGEGKLPYLNTQLSLAYPPVYHDQVVTIRLKPYRWSDGEPVDANDVLFWMHMLQAVGATDYGAYVRGEFPDNVQSVRKVSSTEVQMVIKGPYSRIWFTYNELSQITPMPKAWDRTGPNTPSDCTDQVSDCAAVFSYLNGQAANPETWVSSPLWRVVDGPWRLTGYNSEGKLTFQLNAKYSGPLPKDHISEFQELPFTSEEAEYNVLQAGGGQPLDVGYLPTVDAPVPPPGAPVGQNPVAGYQLQALYEWGISYIPYNFNPADAQAGVVRQQYIRQALQLLVNQAAVIQGPLHGYGQVSTGPVGDSPRTSYLSPKSKQGDPFPYNPAQARSLLSSHGWNVDPAGVTSCESPGRGPGECGPGIRAGTQLSLKLVYATGNAWVESALLQLKSNASQLGIDISLTGKTFDDVLAEVFGGCGTPTAFKVCPWQLADWGQGWSYVPDFLPTGDELFKTGAASNIGQYSNHTNDALIADTLRSSSLRAMWTWQDYLTQQLPVMLQPLAPAALVESIGTLHIGVQSPTLVMTPEDWYYVR